MIKERLYREFSYTPDSPIFITTHPPDGGSSFEIKDITCIFNPELNPEIGIIFSGKNAIGLKIVYTWRLSEPQLRWFIRTLGEAAQYRFDTVSNFWSDRDGQISLFQKDAKWLGLRAKFADLLGLIIEADIKVTEEIQK